MDFNTPTTTALYSIEESIKAYRKLCQRNISLVVPDITVDQALILIIANNNEMTQTEIADLVFKDYASMTRIINLMMKKNYLLKIANTNDKRKSKLVITKTGKDLIKKLTPVIKLNRETALRNISEEEINQLYQILNKITKNCK